MIYHKKDIIISQLTHSHLARIIAETLLIKNLPKTLRLPLAIACHYHDHGWKNWENKPILNKKTKYPLDFQQINAFSHIKIWSESREIGTNHHPLIGYLISKHNSYLSTIRLGNTTNQNEKKALITFQETEITQQNKLLTTMDNPPSSLTLKTLQTYLAISDYISLMICLNKTNTNDTINNKPISLTQKSNITTISYPLKNPINYQLHGINLVTKKPWKKEIKIQSITE